MKSLCFSFFFLSAALTGFAQTADETAIKAVIEKEMQTRLDGDAEGRISCFANEPYCLSVSYVAGQIYYFPNEKKDMMAKLNAQTSPIAYTGWTFKNDNYVTHINGAMAFVQFTQTRTTPRGENFYFHSVRNLEKIDGAWKIVYLGSVMFTPED